ncbi:GNAT family N-acetyltransferase [Paenibacillus sp. 453mf]|uniref:GNAT family N-acetyltransferase n=1 Tax=Paenibacillus sp. 453mf TaxID=1761874 RepID=UPI0008EE2AAF|nr:GNAT family N-acetyltransferase [Paenibacillus sp. 453mf]SFS49020.1 Acetyltransferase (GNAT) family protein [Paenibacillus sp. 453mf]
MIIRQAVFEDVKSIARVHVESWRTAYKGVIKDEVLAGLSVEQRMMSWESQLQPGHDQTAVYVAETEEGAIVGFASGGPSRTHSLPYKGELYAIYILDSYRRQGIGLLLMQSIAVFLREQGHDSMFLWALKDNRYRAFYEKWHGVPAGDKLVQIRGEDYTEIAYGWDHLDELIQFKQI